MQKVLMLTGGMGLLTASLALCLNGRLVTRGYFAGLISIAVTLSLFSVVALGATFSRLASSPLTWILICTLAVIFGLRIYRELQAPPWSERN
jgi:hypothetical protein